MNILRKSSSGTQAVPMDADFLSRRQLFIEGEIGPESACIFAKCVMLLNAEDGTAPIDVYVNSPGGEINAGLLMYDVIQSSHAPIRMHCLGRAYSMAAILFLSGRHGRDMLPHGELMLHEPLAGAAGIRSTSSVQELSDMLQSVKQMMVGIIAKHSGRPEEEVDREFSRDRFLKAEECVAFGLCDKIVSFDEMTGGAA